MNKKWAQLPIAHCKLQFSQPNPFLFFSLQDPYVKGHVKILMEGSVVSFIADNDQSNTATITGTAIVDMQPGQKVSDSLLFYVA